ncbi:MAG: hypothetical protein WCT50_03930 [Patescibacteria group bacterium]|jgi:hypothetical protein
MGNTTTNAIIFRHGRKDGNNNITEEQIAEILENGVPGLNEIIMGQKKVIVHFGSDFARTEQTVMAFKTYAEKIGLCEFDGYLPSNNRYGNEEMFAEFMANPEIVAQAKQSNWYEAFNQFNPRFVERVQADMLEALIEDLNAVEPGSTIIMVGHTPTIEWLTFAVDTTGKISRKAQLKELTGFVFTRNVFNLKGKAKPSRQNRIYISGTIGF